MNNSYFIKWNLQTLTTSDSHVLCKNILSTALQNSDRVKSTIKVKICSFRKRIWLNRSDIFIISLIVVYEHLEIINSLLIINERLTLVGRIVKFIHQVQINLHKKRFCLVTYQRSFIVDINLYGTKHSL